MHLPPSLPSLVTERKTDIYDFILILTCSVLRQKYNVDMTFMLQ